MAINLDNDLRMPKQYFSPFCLIVIVFALTVSCYGVGLFKLFTAVWKGRGQYLEALAGTG